MKNIKNTVLLAAVIAATAIGCRDSADVASYNLSKASDNFEVTRRVVFYNGITEQYILVVEGLLSIRDQGSQLEVTVKTGDNKFKKHFLGLSDNVTYFCEQTEPKAASPYYYRVTFKPTSVVPDIRVDLPK